VNHVRAAKHAERAQELLSERTHQPGVEPAEVVLTQQLVEVDVEHLEHDAKVRPVHEVVQHAHDVVLVPVVTLGVEHVQDADFHVGLVEICGVVFYNLHRGLPARVARTAPHHLPERARPEHVSHLVTAVAARRHPLKRRPR
jgi:hypothetical protein